MYDKNMIGRPVVFVDYLGAEEQRGIFRGCVYADDDLLVVVERLDGRLLMALSDNVTFEDVGAKRLQVGDTVEYVGYARGLHARKGVVTCVDDYPRTVRVQLLDPTGIVRRFRVRDVKLRVKC